MNYKDNLKDSIKRFSDDIFSNSVLCSIGIKIINKELIQK